MSAVKNISIIGSTGSIGLQAIEIIRRNKDKFRLFGIAAKKSISEIEKQVAEFKPQICVIADEKLAGCIDERKYKGTCFFFGEKHLTMLAEAGNRKDILLLCSNGISALRACEAAIKKQKRVALANKEVLVSLGEYMVSLSKEYKAEIIPVDSEHSAIFQCISNNKNNINRIILTASGGAFRDFTKKQLTTVTADMALRHPNWNMGKKITVDSASMMNKGLEIIEAKYFFGLEPSKVEAVMHRESIIHSMVEFDDFSVLAQLSYPTMEIPITYAFTYPNRIKTVVKPLNLAEIGRLSFSEIDFDKYPCVRIACDALKAGGMNLAVLNAANDAAVDLFLNGQIAFTDIPVKIEKALDKFGTGDKPDIDSVYYTDSKVKEFIYKM